MIISTSSAFAFKGRSLTLRSSEDKMMWIGLWESQKQVTDFCDTIYGKAWNEFKHSLPQRFAQSTGCSPWAKFNLMNLRLLRKLFQRFLNVCQSHLMHSTTLKRLRSKSQRLNLKTSHVDAFDTVNANFTALLPFARLSPCGWNELLSFTLLCLLINWIFWRRLI